MQQQFFSLSPMAGQETFGNLDVRPVMAHTPTTSSMLAALQADTFGSGLDPTSSSFGPDAFSSLGFMDTAATPEDSIHLNSANMSYSDYTAGPSGFDVTAFTPQDLGLSASGTPPPTSSEPDSEVDLVKTES
jgi:regulatory factor X, other